MRRSIVSWVGFVGTHTRKNHQLKRSGCHSIKNVPKLSSLLFLRFQGPRYNPNIFNFNFSPSHKTLENVKMLTSSIIVHNIHIRINYTWSMTVTRHFLLNNLIYIIPPTYYDDKSKVQNGIKIIENNYKIMIKSKFVHLIFKITI